MASSCPKMTRGSERSRSFSLLQSPVLLTTLLIVAFLSRMPTAFAQPTATSAPWPSLQANPSPNMVCDKTSLEALDLDFIGGVTTGVATMPWTGEGVFYVDDQGDVMFVFLSPKAAIVSAGPTCNASITIRIVDGAATFGEGVVVSSLLMQNYNLYIAAAPYVWVIEQLNQPLGALIPHKLAGPFSDDLGDMAALPFVVPDFPSLLLIDNGAKCLRAVHRQEAPNTLADVISVGNCVGANDTVETTGSPSLNFVKPLGIQLRPQSGLVFDQDETSVKIYKVLPDMSVTLEHDLANSVLRGLKITRVMKAYLSTVGFLVVDRSYNFNCSVFRLHSKTFDVSSLAEHCIYPESLVATANGTVFLFADDTAETFPPSGSEGMSAAGPETHMCDRDGWPLVDANTFYMADTLCQEANQYQKHSSSSATVIVVAVVVPVVALLGLFVVLFLLLRRRQKPIQAAPALEDGSTKGDRSNPASDAPSSGPPGTIAGSRDNFFTIAHSTPSSSFDIPEEGDGGLAESQQLTQRDIILSLLRSQAPSRPAAISSAFEVEEPSKKGSSSSSPPGTLVSEGSVGAIHGEENFAEYRDLIRSGKYHKLKLIGRGAYGSVYSCILANGKTIAVKEMLLSPEDFGTIAGDVEREIEVMRQIQHENVIQYISAKADTKTGRISLFMELVTGGSLGSMARSVKEPLPEVVIRRLIRQAIEGLAFIHSKGIIHRDIKGDNMLLTADGVVKLADFGTAKSLAPGASRGAQTMIGTPYFMAPELLNGGNDGDVGYGVKADVWSLGITVGELLNKGTPPWPSFANPGQAFLHIAGEGHVPTLPEHTSDLAKDFVLTCCRRDAGGRPSCAQLLEHPWLQEGEPAELLQCESVDFS